MTLTRVRVCLADDHTLVRTGIRRILEARARNRGPGGSRRRRPRAARWSATTDADVLVLDLNMPGTDGIDVLRGVKAAHPQPEGHRAHDACGPGVCGAGDEGRRRRVSAEGLRRPGPGGGGEAVVAGQTYFSPTIQQTMAGLLRGDDAAPASRVQPLTDRERRSSAGWPAASRVKKWRRRLNISVRTVESHRANLMHKLGVKSVALLIQVAIREGMIDRPRLRSSTDIQRRGI